jgi:hypothetical protein
MKYRLGTVKLKWRLRCLLARVNPNQRLSRVKAFPRMQFLHRQGEGVGQAPGV